jgi:hypothetical protein
MYSKIKLQIKFPKGQKELEISLKNYENEINLFCKENNVSKLEQ